MTKHIRIENADTSNFKVVVEVWEKGQGEAPHVLVHTERLDHPTAMTRDHAVYLTSTRYVLVKESD